VIKVALLKKRIGILGGTFNPVHIGHLILAQDAMEAFELSKMLFVPCDKPPHKEASSLISAEYRAAMLELALEENMSAEICDLEIMRGGTTYSIDTVRKLSDLYPDHELLFVIGSDTLPELYQWKDINELLKLCRFVTICRPGFALKAVTEKDLKLDSPWPRILLRNVFVGHQIDVSSSDIRHRVAEGMSIRYLVPAAVEMYIAEHSLYTRA